MHNQASDWPTPSGFKRHHLNLEGFVGDSPFWGRFWEVPDLTPSQRDQILVAREKIALQLTAYGEHQRTYSMIHADLHSDNLMVDGESLTVYDLTTQDSAGISMISLWRSMDTGIVKILICYSKQRSGAIVRNAVSRIRISHCYPYSCSCVPLH